VQGSGLRPFPTRAAHKAGMTFNENDHLRGAGGRFTVSARAEPDLDLGTVPDWDAWRVGLEIPTFRRGKKFTEYTRRGNPVRISAGVIDSEARQVFTRGQCMALVVVLCEANAGTPVAAFEPGTDSLAHALVRLPDGSLLDIDGVHDADKAAESYDLADFDRDDFADKVDKSEGFAKWSDPPNYAMARTFVGAVTERVRTAAIGESTHINR
jgi:hypothetical protein